MSKVTMPKPFGWARDGALGGGMGFQHTISELEALVCSTRPLYTDSQMEAYAAAKVREALEEAAELAKVKYLEHLGRREVEVDEGCDQERWNIAVTSQALAFSVMEHSIRALIPQQ